MPQIDLAQVLAYNMVTNDMFFNAIFKIRRIPGSETSVAMEL